LADGPPRPADKIIIDKIEEISKARKVPMAQVALAWSLQSPWVTAPIIGVRSNERLDELLEGLDLTLTEEELEGINSPYMPLKIRGHN
jgi:aryl-alcohol dehydrogenase-like predicted oxidoreductase